MKKFLWSHCNNKQTRSQNLVALFRKAKEEARKTSSSVTIFGLFHTKDIMVVSDKVHIIPSVRDYTGKDCQYYCEFIVHDNIIIDK